MSVARPGLPGQLRALVVLLARHWARSSVVAGRASGQGGAQSAGLLLRGLFLAALVPAFYSVASRAGAAGAGRVSATRLLVYGVTLYGAGLSLTAEAPPLPGARNLLQNGLLAPLPLAVAARVFFAMGQLGFVLLMQLAVVFGASPERLGSLGGVLSGAALGGMLFLASMLGGLGVASLLRLLLPLALWARLSWLSGAASLVGLLGAMNAPFLGPHWTNEGSRDPLLPVARAVAGEVSLALGLAPPLVLVALGLLALSLAERLGYDRLDAAPAARPPPRAPGPLPLWALEGLVASREMGGRTLVLSVVVVSTTLSGLMAWASRRVPAEVFRTLAVFVGVMLGQIGGSAAIGRAGRSVLRDARARPLLGSLPIGPNDTLTGKASALRRLLWPLPLGFVPWIAVAPSGLRIEFAWRAVALLVGLAVLSEAAVCVAFLTNGLGARATRASGASLNVGTLLLFLPFLGAVTAASPLPSALSLLALGAVSFEARRAARRCVRWIDDADEQLARDTPVWRALLVFAAFQAVGAMSAQLLTIAAPGLAAAMRAALSSSLAAIALLLMTHLTGVQLSWRRLRPGCPWALLAGLAAGGATGALGVLSQQALRRGGALAPWAPPGRGADLVALFAAAAVLGPLADEVFFRGWLQEAIAAELPPRLGPWAVVLSSLAFAASSPQAAFVPALLLGVATGGLYARTGSLPAAMLAHAIHSAVLLLARPMLAGLVRRAGRS